MRATTDDGVGLHYEVDGPDGAPWVLLCHSLGCDLDMWQPQLSALAERFRVVRFDLRGHGSSDAPSGPYTIAELGRDALAVLDAAGAERAHVVGVSLGGLVALWLAAEHPERVARLVLANTAARIGTPELWDQRVAAVRSGGMTAIADAVIARFFTSGFVSEHPDVVERTRGTLTAQPPEGYVGCCLALREADLRARVAAVDRPTLVVAGSDDVPTPVEDAVWLHQQLPASELVVIDGAAHLSNVERPDRFTAAVLGHLEGAG